MGLQINGSPLFGPGVGSIRCIFSSDFHATRSVIREQASRLCSEARLVSIECGGIAALDLLLKQLIRGLSEAALALWPDWYDGSLAMNLEPDRPANAISDQLTTRRLAESKQSVLATWLTASIAACRQGRIPFCHSFHRRFKRNNLRSRCPQENSSSLFIWKTAIRLRNNCWGFLASSNGSLARRARRCCA